MWIEISRTANSYGRKKVTSYAEVWIEIECTGHGLQRIFVTSYAEVWIEIGSERSSNKG